MTYVNQVQVKQEEKQLHCFTCGKEIKFSGYGSRVRLNIDGSLHVCSEADKETYNGGSQRTGQRRYSRYQRRNRWYWGYGPGAYHKRNKERYSSQDYESRRKAAEDQYNSYRQRYSNKEANFSESQALEILGLAAEVLKLKYEEKVKAIKAAFRALCLKFHPDRKPDGNAAKFIEVNGAYEILMNGRSK